MASEIVLVAAPGRVTMDLASLTYTKSRRRPHECMNRSTKVNHKGNEMNLTEKRNQLFTAAAALVLSA